MLAHLVILEQPARTVENMPAQFAPQTAPGSPQNGRRAMRPRIVHGLDQAPRRLAPPAPTHRHARSRDGRPETIYWVENTVRAGRRLIDPAVRGVVLDCFQRALSRHPVELFGLSVRADGYALLIRALDDRLPVVLRDVQSGLARALNRARGVRGSLWAGKVRYRPMRSHPDAMSHLVELLLDAGEGDRLSSADALLDAWVDDGVELPPHTILPWFGTLDDAQIAERLSRAISARRAAARRWRLAVPGVSPID